MRGRGEARQHEIAYNIMQPIQAC